MDTIRKKMSYGYFFIDQNFSRILEKQNRKFSRNENHREIYLNVVYKHIVQLCCSRNETAK